MLFPIGSSRRNGVLVRFVDVPEAHTFGATEADAGGDNALDCLIAALGGYIRLGRAIPRPSPARERPVAILPPLVSAKLTVYEAMRAERVTRTELARRLGLQENAVRRLLDLNHRSHIDQIDRALSALAPRGARPRAGVFGPSANGNPSSARMCACGNRTAE